MAYSVINFELVKDDEGRDIINGWIDAESDYKEFDVDIDGELKYTQMISKERFRDLDHFSGVMGKFDPFVIFFDPKKVDDLNFESLLPLM